LFRGSGNDYFKRDKKMTDEPVKKEREWIALDVQMPEIGQEVELMSFATHKGKYEPTSAEVWILDPLEEVVGNVSHWRELEDAKD